MTNHKASGSAGTNWFHFSGLNQLDPEELKRKLIRVDTADSTSSDSPTIAWLGHASFVLSWAGKTILIDPVFAKRMGGMPRRIGVRDEVYAIKPDAILISHAHMDHLHGATLERYGRAIILLPRRSEKFLPNEIKNKIFPLSEGETFSLGPLQIQMTQAKHGGWRYPWQNGYTAVGFLITRHGSSIYYAGDTAFGEHFQEIGENHTVDTALLPIGAYAPRWFLKSRHLNPPEAVHAAELLKAKTVIPFHFGTYRLSWDPVEQALPWFVKEATNKGVRWQLNYDRNLIKTD